MSWAQIYLLNQMYIIAFACVIIKENVFILGGVNRMKRFIFFALLFLLSACQASQAEDEGLLAYLSDEEIVPGYLLFESATGQYDMYFPQSAQLEEKQYEKRTDSFEHLVFEAQFERFPEGVFHVDLVYHEEDKYVSHLTNIASSFIKEADYLRVETDDTVIYYVLDHFNALSAHYMIGYVAGEGQRLQFEMKLPTGNHKLSNDELTVFRDEMIYLLKSVTFR